MPVNFSLSFPARTLVICVSLMLFKNVLENFFIARCEFFRNPIEFPFVEHFYGFNLRIYHKLNDCLQLLFGNIAFNE